MLGEVTKRKNRILFIGRTLLMAFLSAWHPAQAQHLPIKPAKEQYCFEPVTLPKGEPIRDVLNIVQDNRGFVWMASLHGLFRYDGHDFKMYHHTPGDSTTLVDTETYALLLLGDTALCVGTARGVTLMDLHTEKMCNFRKDTEGNPIRYVSEFFLDDDQTLWLGGLDGLYSFAADFSSIAKRGEVDMPPIKKGDPAFLKRVYSIKENSQNNHLLMLGTGSGLIGFDKKTNTMHRHYPNTKATYYRSQPSITNIVTDGHYLWCKSWFSGFNRFDMESETWDNFDYPYTEECKYVVLNSLVVKNEDALLFCDVDRGLGVFSKKEGSSAFVYDSLPQSVLRRTGMRLFMQSDSTLWLANKEGLWRQNRQKNLFKRLEIPYFYTWVMPVLHDEKNADYYFGLVHKTFGLACWNADSGTWSYLQTATDKEKELNAYDLFQDHQGVVWVATRGRGLWFVDKKNKQLKPFTFPDGSPLGNARQTLYKIFEDSRGNLWIGTAKSGVLRIDALRAKATYFTHDPDDSLSIIGGSYYKAIEEDGKGRIWIGNRQGFCTFDPQTETFSDEIPRKMYHTGLLPGYTYSIVKDTAGTMWMAIEGQGLVSAKENPDGTFGFRVFQTDDGLKDLMVRHMAKDHEGNLWLMNNGLLYFNPYNESFMLTDDRNGLLENLSGDDRISFDGHGNVFCGNQVGLNWMQEAKEMSESSISNLIVEKVMVNGNPINWCYESAVKPIKLSGFRNENNIIFNYTAICFDRYDQVRYRYKLEGLEDAWSQPTKLLEARYTNLRPGRYRFVVDVAYKGNWLGWNKHVDFKITRPFWQTGWFLAALGALAVSVVYLVCLNRKRLLEKQNRIRQKIASDLHDDVGSTLSSISIMSDILQYQTDSDSPVGNMIKEIGSNAHNMLESMDDIIWSVNPSNDKFENLILRIKEYSIPLFESKDIGFSFTVPEALQRLSLPMDVRKSLFLIAKEAINNLAKYSEASQADVVFTLTDTTVEMKISDNGKGFDIEKINTSRNGLKNMQNRAKEIHAELYIDSKVNVGTQVLLVLQTHIFI